MAMVGHTWTVLFAFTCILSGHVCLDIYPISGPWVVESGSEPWVELACTFTHNSTELNQLDLKWYFKNSAQPFIQWVPSTGRKPQSIGDLWNNRLELVHTSRGNSLTQTVRLQRPTIEFSGEYECKVSTFHEEKSSKLKMLVYDPGEGPRLQYQTAEDGYVNVSCSSHRVYPEPILHLSWNSGLTVGDVSKMTARRGQEFDVTVHSLLPPTEIQPETVFTCVMEIPDTQFSLREETMYFPGRIQPRASLVSGSTAVLAHSLSPVLVAVLAASK